MTRVAIIYHSEEGQTAKIAARLGELVRNERLEVDIYPLADAPGSLTPFDVIVLGASIHLGSHGGDLARYVSAHLGELHAKPDAFFSVSLTASQKDDVHQDQAHAVVDSLLKETGWQPDLVALFGGALAYRRYGFLKRHLMKRIAAHEGGPTDTSRDWDLTDWDDVEAFARDISACARLTGAETG